MMALQQENTGLTNIIFENVNINGKNNVGCLAGKIKQFGENPIIENCMIVSGNINGEDNVGGLIGLSETDIELVNCIIKSGYIKGQNNVGGLLGSCLVVDAASQVSLCNNTNADADVEGLGSNVGGLIGYVNSFKVISNCVCSANVSANGIVGGILGCG